MARTTVIHHIPPHAGWPNGEPQRVRDAYDEILQSAAPRDEGLTLTFIATPTTTRKGGRK